MDPSGFSAARRTWADFEPEAPSVLEAKHSCPLAREVLYQAELRAHEYEKMLVQFALHQRPHSCISLHQLPKDVEGKKEVIQPQVPLRLPCDDLAHLAELRFATANFAGAHLNPARVA